MKKSVVIEYFGSSRALANVLHIAQPAIVKWDTTIPTKRVKQLTQIIDKDFLKLFGETIINNGYSIVPLPHASKYPAGVPDWNNMKMSAGSIGFWVKDKGYDGIGIPGRITPAVDIDVHSTELSEKLVEFITNKYPNCLKRVGQAPKVLIPFRCDAPLKKRMRMFIGDDGNREGIEILADGQQWVAFGVHPDTGLPYQWLDDGNSILNVPHGDLPVLTEDFIDELFVYFDSIVPGTWQHFSNIVVKPETSGLERYKPSVEISEDELKEALTYQS